MSEPPPVDPPPTGPRAPHGPPTPGGALENLRFGGILEVRGGSRDNLLAVVRRINAIGLAQAELDSDGGRHSLMFDDQPVSGSAASNDQIDRLVEELQALLDASESPVGAESTLHCTAIHTDGVIETLIGVEQGRVHPVSRVRSRTPPPIDTLSEQRRVAWVRVSAVVLLFVIGSTMMAWQFGYIDRVLASSATDLKHDLGPFENRLEFDLERSWGRYKITIRRGPGFPVDPAAAKAQADAATGFAESTAAQIIADGGTLYVQLVNANGQVLESTAIELRPLIEAPDGKATCELHGRVGAKSVRLALSKGTDD